MANCFNQLVREWINIVARRNVLVRGERKNFSQRRELFCQETRDEFRKKNACEERTPQFVNFNTATTQPRGIHHLAITLGSFQKFFFNHEGGLNFIIFCHLLFQAITDRVCDIIATKKEQI
jgi:hypothetical protein